MSDNEKEDTALYKVVLNHEEQYSIWPADRENALGWQDAGKTGTKAECLEYIKEVWTDMRPLSLRKKMEEAATNTYSPPLLSSLPAGNPGKPVQTERSCGLTRPEGGSSRLPHGQLKSLNPPVASSAC